MCIYAWRRGDCWTLSGKIEVILEQPVDSTLTNLLIYNGLVYLIANVGIETKSYPNRIFLKSDALTYAYKTLDYNIIEKITLQPVGNDKKYNILGDFLRILKIKLRDKLERNLNYMDALRLLRENSDKLENIVRKIIIKTHIKNKEVVIGEIEKGKSVKLQLFKSERYKGLTSTEHRYSTSNLSTAVSPDVMLLALLGLYSSFVTSMRIGSGGARQQDSYYFFIFLSPDEIIEILSGYKDAKIVSLIKDEARGILKEIIKQFYNEELLTTEMCLHTKLLEAMSKYNVSSLSLLILKVKEEGGRTYKIYESIPITVYYRKWNELYKILGNMVEPGSIILERLRNNDNIEYNNLVSFVTGLYRFSILNDIAGLYVALRELHAAYIKVKTDEKLSREAVRYAKILRRAESLAKYL